MLEKSKSVSGGKANLKLNLEKSKSVSGEKTNLKLNFEKIQVSIRGKNQLETELGKFQVVSGEKTNLKLNLENSKWYQGKKPTWNWTWKNPSYKKIHSHDEYFIKSQCLRANITNWE